MYIFSNFIAYNTITHMHNTHTHTHTHTCTQSYIRAMGLKKRLLKRGFQGRFKRNDRGGMMNRNRELVPDNWSLVRLRERALTTGLCSEGWYSEHAGVLPIPTLLFSLSVSVMLSDLVRIPILTMTWCNFIQGLQDHLKVCSGILSHTVLEPHLVSRLP